MKIKFKTTRGKAARPNKIEIITQGFTNPQFEFLHFIANHKTHGDVGELAFQVLHDWILSHRTPLCDRTHQYSFVDCEVRP